MTPLTNEECQAYIDEIPSGSRAALAAAISVGDVTHVVRCLNGALSHAVVTTYRTNTPGIGRAWGGNEIIGLVPDHDALMNYAQTLASGTDVSVQESNGTWTATVTATPSDFTGSGDTKFIAELKCLGDVISGV